MRTVLVFTAIWLVPVALPLAYGQEPAPPVPRVTTTTQAVRTDLICELLFREYVLNSGKVNADEREAAICLIARRGRENGFWQQVLDTYRTASDSVADACVLILGRMLVVDARGREIVAAEKRTGRPYGGQWGGPYIVLPDEVVDLIVRRAAGFTGSSRRAHLVALVQADDPRAKPVFEPLLEHGTTLDLDGCAVFAAVGLANLGQERGVQWLIEHCESKYWLGYAAATIGETHSPWLDELCQTALRVLSGHHVRRDTRDSWQRWLHSTPRPFVPAAKVSVEGG
jgi:hypothetical protein